MIGYGVDQVSIDSVNKLMDVDSGTNLKITQELVEAVTEKVYTLLLSELRTEKERLRLGFSNFRIKNGAGL